MLYSPINYQGNKSRIVSELLKYIPSNTDEIHEVFCGSGILSFASDINKIYLSDTNQHILDLIEYFKNVDADEIIKRADSIIREYGLTNTYYEGKGKYVEHKHEGLSRYNKEPYLRLRDDYNSDKDINKLFVLVIYGFDHYLRFNSDDIFNVPIGKTDFVDLIRKRTIAYGNAVQSKNLVILNSDFRNIDLYKNCSRNALFYFDPPYLITEATYNSYWSENDEIELLELLDSLNDKGYKFMLSNVILSNGKENKILQKWMNKYNVVHIERRYLNSNYQKKNLSGTDEVIIFNYKEKTNYGTF